MTEGVLVIGYGNALRTDDGVGRHVAERLADDPRLGAATVIGRHQLTPELALDVSEASLLILIDASHGAAAGAFTVERLVPTTDAGPAWTHHLSPGGLLALAQELYGRAPEAVLFGVGVASVEMGERLSPEVEAALPRLMDAVVDQVAAHAHRDTPAAAGTSRHA